MQSFEKKFKIPSNGYFGGPKEVVLRNMTTKEEKIIYNAKDYSFLERIIESCCVQPRDLDINTLHPNDILYLTYVLRDLTFGNTYEQEIVCPECGFRQTVTIDIAKMEALYLETEELDEKLTVTLPYSGDVVKLKILSNADINAITKEIKMLTNKGKLKDPETYEFILKMCASIETINGEEITDKEQKRGYVDTMHMKDSRAIQNALNQISFGIDTSNIVTCSKCGEDVEVAGLICPEFFRPTK